MLKRFLTATCLALVVAALAVSVAGAAAKPGGKLNLKAKGYSVSINTAAKKQAASVAMTSTAEAGGKVAYTFTYKSASTNPIKVRVVLPQNANTKTVGSDITVTGYKASAFCADPQGSFKVTGLKRVSGNVKTLKVKFVLLCDRAQKMSGNLVYAA